QGFHNPGNGGSFLADCHIYTINRVTRFIKLFLVNNGIDANGRLPCLTVADNQLTLSASNRNHCVDSLDTRLERFFYRFAEDNPRRLAFQWHFVELTLNGALPIDRVTEHINNAANQPVTHTD